jgi:hypothetical protein
MISDAHINTCYAETVTKKKSTRGGSRPGAGRKPILRDRVGLTVHVDGEQYDQLAKMAEEKQQSLGSLVREAITTYLKRRKKG